MDHSEHSEHEQHHEHEQHDHNAHHRMMAEDFKKRFWVSLLLTIPILFLSPLIADLLNYEVTIDFTGSRLLLFAFSTIVFVYGGKPFVKGMIDELRGRNPGMMTLVAVAITVAYAYSSAVVFGLEGKLFFWELATLIDVMLVGHWVEMRSILGASKALEELSMLMPSKAHKITSGGKTEDVDLADLSIGDLVLVKPGEKIPADGMVVEGETKVNEALLTGESNLVSKAVDDEVIGGSINTDGSITVKVQKLGKDSFLNQIIALVQEAQDSKSQTQDLANKAARWLTVIGVGGGALTLVLWLVLSDQSFAFAIERAVTVMVITCPHALGLAIPLVVAVSTSKSARSGLLIRNRQAFERAKDIDAVVFDKTGTLTMGNFEVEDVLLADGYDKDRATNLAASLESHSQHPIAQAIGKLSDKKLKVTGFKAIAGVGIEGVIDGKNVKVVSPGYIEENKLEAKGLKVKNLKNNAKTTVFLIENDKLVAAFVMADIIREESRQAIESLKQAGIKTFMLTGDSAEVAKQVAKDIGIDDYFAQVLPDAKSAKIKELQASGLRVAMVGDGINDAPALAQADVGIAIGSGTDVAAETADIILVKNDPRNVVDAIAFSKATYRKMLQNLGWATGYNLIAIPLAAGALYSYGILVSPAIGAFFMSLSTVVVAINAKFLGVDESS